MTTIVAFDYNGTLNTEEGLEFYKKQKAKDDTVVGVLTGNLIINVQQFSSQEEINPDFIRRGVFKAPELIFIAIIDGEGHIYVGNSKTDRIAANIAGWKYIDINSL